MNSVTIVWDDAIALWIDGLELDQRVPTAGISCDMHRNSTASIGARRRGTDDSIATVDGTMEPPQNARRVTNPY